MFATIVYIVFMCEGER